MTTIHANTPRDAMSRIEAMVGMSGVNMSETLVRQTIARSLEIIVQLSPRHRRQAPDHQHLGDHRHRGRGDHHAGDLPVRADRDRQGRARSLGEFRRHRRPAAGAGAHRPLRHRSGGDRPRSTCRSDERPWKQFLIGARRAGGGGPVRGRWYHTLRFFTDRKQEELRRRLQTWAAAEPAPSFSLLREGKLSALPFLDDLLRGLAGCSSGWSCCSSRPR